MENKQLSLLIVEDEAAARTGLCKMISMRFPGLIVHSADNGESGLERFKLHSPDIIITDLCMPVMDGIAMSAEMKSLNPDVAIIALTSYTDTKFLMMSIEIGIDHYLQKPLVFERLYSIIDSNIVAISDMHHRRRMEKELQAQRNELKLANEMLEQRVSERTADLEAAIREMESFSYSVSHDLRAPLRHINSFTSVLIEEHAEEFSSKVRDYLDRICQASSRMGALIDHLLELSRVARTEINPGKVDLSELATSSLRMYRETEPERVVESVIEEGIEVSGDHYLLKQLLDNLLGNAWKYTSKKPQGLIEFRRALVAGEEAYYIKDNGAGFDMVYHEKLFKAFERLHGTEYEGIGIGLATAQRIVQRHGGKIWAEGSTDQGAAFYFTLPAYF